MTVVKIAYVFLGCPASDGGVFLQPLHLTVVCFYDPPPPPYGWE